MTAESWSAIISGIALVAAVTSPVITTMLNNRHQNKVNSQKYYDEHRAQIIENYIQSVGELCGDFEREEYLRAYGKSSKEIYLYLPTELWEHVDNIDNAINNSDLRQASLLLTNLCKELTKYPPRFIKKKSNQKND